MDFKVVSKNNKCGKNKTRSVNIPESVLNEVIDLLSCVECTCVWSPVDNQYVKVNDIPTDLVEQLKMHRSLSKLDFNQT